MDDQPSSEGLDGNQRRTEAGAWTDGARPSGFGRPDRYELATSSWGRPLSAAIQLVIAGLLSPLALRCGLELPAQ
ncbi:uncharacterized protein TrAtP1_001781 [Trichoderma atroviride]|uniref:uncharacterized protein n=1 Tax=Hypocrea atroviridis TaxID=63577 RepID=UPI0033271DB9|nr:hypothetical protein TrAtP1_001781 [Trichoderma atroviride]